MRVTIMHNPKAGEGEPSGSELREMIRNAGHTPVYQSTKEDDYELALEAPGDLVAVAGGDGTVRKVAKHLVGRETPMAILPVGTANNIANTLGITGSFQRLISEWSSMRPRKFDVGLAKGPWGEKPFFEGVGFGLLSRMMAMLDDGDKFDDADEKLIRDFSVFKEILPDYSCHGLRFKLDGDEVSGFFALAEIMNIKLVGPNLHLAPGADPSDGYFDCVFVSEQEREDLARYLSDCLEGKQCPVSLRTQKARRIEIHWEGCEIHIDDKVWPDKEDSASEVPSSALIELSLKSGTLEILTGSGSTG